MSGTGPSQDAAATIVRVRTDPSRLTRSILFAVLAAASVAPTAFAQNRASDRQQDRSSTPTTGGAEGDRRACEEQKKRFMDSQACFQKYRLATGAVRPEAYQRCTEVKQPRGC